MAYAIDRQGISGALYNGEALFSDFIVAPDSQWGRAADSSITRYPLDPRRTEQLMTDAGYTRGGDGTWANAANGRFVVELMGDNSADNVAENSIVAAQWRQAGFDVQEAILSLVLAQDPQARATFSGFYTQNTNNSVAYVAQQASSQIPSADNHWSGQNKGGWSNSDYDRLVAAFTTTLDPTQREQQLAGAARIFTDDLPYISLFFRTQPWAFVKGLTGLQLVGSDSNMSWNIHEWEFK
jgi:peptide/nickel transport system substrate-binding protein